MLNAGFSTLNAGFSMLDAGFSTLDAGFSILDPGYPPIRLRSGQAKLRMTLVMNCEGHIAIPPSTQRTWPVM